MPSHNTTLHLAIKKIKRKKNEGQGIIDRGQREKEKESVEEMGETMERMRGTARERDRERETDRQTDKEGASIPCVDTLTDPSIVVFCFILKLSLKI